MLGVEISGETPEKGGVRGDFVAGKYFGLFFVQCEGFEICGLISSQQGRDNSLPQELFGNVWRVFVVVVVTITGKNGI